MQAYPELPHYPDLSLIRRGDFRAIARAITFIENSMPGSDAMLHSLSNRHAPVIGITGPPGAGKSTLLKIVSRITDPSEGYIKLRGRLASLLEVGTGFHPELTGRENTIMNGAIHGMRRAERVSQ